MKLRCNLGLCVAASCTVAWCAIAAAASPVAVVWSDREDAELGPLHDALQNAGFSTQDISAADLAARLDGRANPDLLVLPDGGRYPAPAADAILAFLNGGGALAVLGGVPLTQPLVRVGDEWVEIGGGKSGASALPVDGPWSKDQALMGVEFTVTTAEDGETVRFEAKDFRGYAYGGTRIPEVPFDDAILVFEARDAGDTPRLCIEIGATDGSRWKSIVPLDASWRTYRIHIGDFVPYNSPERVGADDYCRPGEARKLAFGIASGMVGTGRRAFDLRGVRFEEAVVPAAMLKTFTRLMDPMCSVKRWYGEPVGPEEFVATPFSGSRPVDVARLTAPDGHAVPYAGLSEEGRWSLPRAPAPVVSAGNPKLEERARDHVTALTQPLIEARDTAGESRCVARFSAFLTGPLAGGRHVVFGLPVDSLATSSLTRQAFRHGLDLAREGVFIGCLEPAFDGSGRIAMRAGVFVPPGCVNDVEVSGAVERNGTTWQSEWTNVAPSASVQWVTLDTEAPLGEQEEAYSLALSVRGASSESVLGHVAFDLNPRETFRAICDFLRDYVNAHGQLHGNRFIDSRGMRALFAGYDLFGDETYRDAALRWFDAKVVGDQRDDGGYRMGYGVGKKGESCYVADGGEIAVGVAQAACYTSGEHRAAILASLDRYMDYRESFRVDTGGIGVGWCLHDYGQRPVVPLDEPTRIYAPEKNTYTIGCTLAGAYAHARLHKDATLEQRAAMDADWLMERAQTLNGAYIESYMYAHALTRDAARKAAYVDFMRTTFRDKMAANSGKDWWLTGGGRTALNLDGLAYWLHVIDPGDGEIRLALHRALARMFSPDSAQSIPMLIESGVTLSHDEWIYICYGSMSLADVIQPMVTMARLTGLGEK